MGARESITITADLISSNNNINNNDMGEQEGGKERLQGHQVPKTGLRRGHRAAEGKFWVVREQGWALVSRILRFLRGSNSNDG